MRMILNILFVGMAAYVGLLLLLYFFQDQMLYFPTEQHIASPSNAGLLYEDVWIETSDQETLHAWWVPAASSRGAVIFCHGNGGNISGRVHSVEQFHRLGMDVLIFDYRGYGRSTGSPSEQGIYRDMAAVWGHITQERNVAPEDIVLFGRSLGGAPAAWLAAQQSVGALILESAFTSVPDIAAHHYPIFPTRLLARSSFNTLDLMPEIDVPVLVIHSQDDEIIPFEHGRRLYEAARKPRVFYELQGGHNEGHLTGGASYHEALDRFLSAHLNK